MTEPRTCPAATKTGRPCRRRPSPGHELCPIHEGHARRPLLLTDHVITELDRLIRAGVPKVEAVLLAGVTEGSFWRWMEVGEADHEHDRDTPQRRLWLTVRVATAAWKADTLSLIRQAARGETAGQWQAAAWLLERRYPGEFGRRTVVAGDPAAPAVRVELPELDPADKMTRDLAHRLLDRASGRPHG